nr:probable steroid-binding protein 3 [Ipomoea batatas]
MEFSTQQLKGYDGTDPSKPIYMAIRAASSTSPPVGTSMVLVGAYPSSLAKISKNAEDVSPSLKAKETGVDCSDLKQVEGILFECSSSYGVP